MYTIFLSKETLLVSLVMIPDIVRYLGHGRSLWTNWRRNKFLGILSLLFSDSTLLVGETKIVVLAETILGEEKSHPKPIQSEADF